MANRLNKEAKLNALMFLSSPEGVPKISIRDRLWGSHHESAQHLPRGKMKKRVKKPPKVLVVRYQADKSKFIDGEITTIC